MKTIKQALRPERLRKVPEQFSWVDQALVQHHLIDRCDSHMAALYLFLVTVADAQGLSYYGAATLAARLHLSVRNWLRHASSSLSLSSSPTRPRCTRCWPCLAQPHLAHPGRQQRQQGRRHPRPPELSMPAP